MKDRVQLLVDILLDKGAREDERDDAAIDLRHYNDIRALRALIEVTSDATDIDTIVDNSAESLAFILIKRDEFDECQINTLIPWAKKTVLDVIRENKPGLIK
ncbi:hypothetical protein [Undibacterium sp.]|uniref:hypothetical protein n=1 Tax=Undibacterium sp. TaxID=1914977 RepID=UPI00272F1C86|nr:hypothetical protein [Undibacterium sp.]MDP1978694.1 hypothetical protein [Undibacterium sp.]